jgi:hypothetical protein
MARYRCLAPIYTPGGAYVEISQTVGDEGNAEDIAIPTSYIPPPCLDPLNADAIAKLGATRNGTVFVPQPSPSSGCLGLWGIRSQFQTLPLPLGTPSAAWKNLVKPQ